MSILEFEQILQHISLNCSLYSIQVFWKKINFRTGSKNSNWFASTALKWLVLKVLLIVLLSSFYGKLQCICVFSASNRIKSVCSTWKTDTLRHQNACHTKNTVLKIYVCKLFTFLCVPESTCQNQVFSHKNT